MGLPWVRLDSGFMSHPKFLALLDMRDGYRTIVVYMAGLAYAGQHGTDGVIPANALPLLRARPIDVTRLVDLTFWHPYPEGGWLIHNYAERQLTKELSRARSEAGKKGAAARWGRPS